MTTELSPPLAQRWAPSGTEAARDEPLTRSSRVGRPSPEGGTFAQILAATGHQIDHGEKLLKDAMSRVAQLDTASLIALQAGVYRWSETVDLVAKVVDRGNQCLRTILQSGAG
ncbi:hypothetical protein ACFL5O_11040 [Myxococcota bacterium]